MLIDTHAHLDLYEGDLDCALDQIEKYRILTVTSAMDIPSWQRNLEIREKSQLIIPTFGIHPWNAPRYADCLDELTGPVKQTPILGEVGLDHRFVEDRSQYAAQKKVLEYFLDAACKDDKIVVLHTAGAEEEILVLLKRYNIKRTIIHWFSGPLDILDGLLACGVYFTIGPELVYSEHIKRIANTIPDNLLLTETDNPGGPKWLTGKQGMPVLIRDVVNSLARLKGTSAEAITEQVKVNFLKLIGNDPFCERIKMLLEE